MNHKPFALFSAMLFSIVFAFISCNDKEKTQLVPETGKNSSNRPDVVLKVDNDCISTTNLGGPTPLYNCFGFAFVVSETGNNEVLEPTYVRDDFINNGLFKEESGSNATKVLYWQSAADMGDIQSTHHAGIITKWNGSYTSVRSKDGIGNLYDHCISYDIVLDQSTTFYKTYALNMNITSSVPKPSRGQTFTLSLPADGSSKGVSYQWSYNSLQVQLLAGIESYQATFKVLNTAEGSVKISVSAIHQTSESGPSHDIYSKTLTNNYAFILPLFLPLTVSVSGPKCSPAVAQTFTWTAVTSGGTEPFTYSWRYLIFRGTKKISGTGNAKTLSVSLLPGDRMSGSVTVSDSDETKRSMFTVSDDCLPIE